MTLPVNDMDVDVRAGTPDDVPVLLSFIFEKYMTKLRQRARIVM